MSLSPAQRAATQRELQESFDRAGVSVEEVCVDLGITPGGLRRVMELRGDALEDPWILRDYLTERILEQGGEPVAFTALAGDPARHWFLDAQAIRERRLATR